VAIECRFLWSINSNKKKVHKLAWNTVVREKDRGGLGIRLGTENNKAFLFN
jgi:hypothetical protein